MRDLTFKRITDIKDRNPQLLFCSKSVRYKEVYLSELVNKDLLDL